MLGRWNGVDWRVPARGGVVTSDTRLNVFLAEAGLGLAYAFETMVEDSLRTGRLVRVLESYAPTVPGFFLYYPSAAQRSAPLRVCIETAKELAARMMPTSVVARPSPQPSRTND